MKWLLFLILMGPQANSTTEAERDQIRNLVYWLPTNLCAENRLARKCVVWTSGECESQIESFANSCLRLIEPEMMQSRTTASSSWRSRILKCTVREVELQMKSRIKKNDICKDLSGGL